MIRLLGKAMIDISTFCILLFLFLFTYSILGMEWFAYYARFDSSWNVDLIDGKYIDQNFNSFIQAFTTVFVVLTGDNWCDIFYKHLRSVGWGVSTFFFLSLKIVG